MYFCNSNVQISLLNSQSQLSGTFYCIVLHVLLLQPSGPSGGATIKPPGAVKLGVGAELRPAASLGVALGGKWGAGGGRGRVYNYEKDMLGEGGKVEPFC